MRTTALPLISLDRECVPYVGYEWTPYLIRSGHLDQVLPSDFVPIEYAVAPKCPKIL